MPHALESLLGSPEPMLRTISADMQARGLADGLVCDHICYRVETEERYQELKDALQAFSSLATETMIAGRLISILHLHEPYTFGDREIACVELPAPKAGSPYKEGWEHAEFVTKEPLDVFMQRHAHVAFGTRGAGKKLNPEITVDAGGGFQIKFHPLHILDVIAIERKMGMNKPSGPAP